MKTGKTLQELAAELERQSTQRKDYVAPQAAIEAVVMEDFRAPLDDTQRLPATVQLAGLNGESYAITPHAHRQFADHLAIPQRYYDRMRAEQPALLAQNLNTWLKAQPAERRMIRTLDGQVRAFMSHKYRPLDNFELANAILPKLLQLNVSIASCELTETRMYIKAILPDLSDALPAGAAWGSGHVRVAGFDGEPGKVVAAIVISNSEVGAGSLRVEPSVFTTWCSNLAVMEEAAMKKYHVGRSADVLDDFSVFRDETRQADDRAFWLKVQDVTAAAFDRKVFEAAVAQIRKAADTPIVSNNLQAVVDATVEVLALPEKVGAGIMGMLARGGDLSQWGLSSAITAVANTADHYELATDLERAGGRVLTLPARKWKTISQAAS